LGVLLCKAMKNPVRKSACVVPVLMLTMGMAVSGQKHAPEPEPVVWGMLSGNASCVIFAEGHKTSGMFWGVAVTTKTVGKLTLVET
jgi:hypothetical protein